MQRLIPAVVMTSHATRLKHRMPMHLLLIQLLKRHRWWRRLAPRQRARRYQQKTDSDHPVLHPIYAFYPRQKPVSLQLSQRCNMIRNPMPRRAMTNRDPHDMDEDPERRGPQRHSMDLAQRKKIIPSHQQQKSHQGQLLRQHPVVKERNRNSEYRRTHQRNRRDQRKPLMRIRLSPQAISKKDQRAEHQHIAHRSQITVLRIVPGHLQVGTHTRLLVRTRSDCVAAATYP